MGMVTLWESDALPSVAFHTLGCRANQLESSALADAFRAEGWQIVSFGAAASLTVINTCTVTSSADGDSRHAIRKAQRMSPDGRIAVTGCYAQMAPDTIAALDGVDYVIGNNFKQDIVDIVRRLPRPETPWVQVSEMDKSRVMAGATTGDIGRTRASLKIQDGCDFKCTYCIIWVARGPSRSLSATTLKTQLADLLAAGHREIVLTGINIGQYEDPDSKTDLAGLLSELTDLPGEYRLRLSSLDPAEVTPALLAVMRNNPRICLYLHLSMQSAEDHVLKRMARRHRAADLVRVCEDIRTALPDAAIGADIITGFPEETAARFEATHTLLEQLPLSYLHVFSYSKREGTPAADFPEQVDDRDKKVRTRRLMDLSERKNLAYRRGFIGREVHVVVESGGTKGMSAEYVPVTLDTESPLPRNTLVPVTITEAGLRETRGRVCLPELNKAVVG